MQVGDYVRLREGFLGQGIVTKVIEEKEGLYRIALFEHDIHRYNNLFPKSSLEYLMSEEQGKKIFKMFG